MALALTIEERKALQLFGVRDCQNAAHLLQREDLIRKVYRKQALTTHPDRAVLTGSDPVQMEKAFQRVSESYRILMDKIILQKGITTRPKKVKVNRSAARPDGGQRGAGGTSGGTSGRKARDGSGAGKVAIGYYQGFVPQKKLRFAEYLYYNRKITWEQLVASLCWQFMNRPKLGELAKQEGYLSDDQVMSVLKSKRSSQRFGLVAVQRGYISVENCKRLLVRQKNLGMPIGKYFRIENILDGAELNEHYMEFLVHNRRFRSRGR